MSEEFYPKLQKADGLDELVDEFKYEINLKLHTPLRCQIINTYCIGDAPDTPKKIAAATQKIAQMARAFDARQAWITN